jgi:hypothetical protein
MTELAKDNQELKNIQTALTQIFENEKEQERGTDLIKVDQHFENIDAIRQAAIRFARRQKFAVSTLRSGSRQLVLVCKHSGEYRQQKLPKEVEQQEEQDKPKKQSRKKLSQKIQCPFQIRAKPSNGRWVIYKIIDEHNHEMAMDIKAYAQHRKLSEETKKLIVALMDTGASNSTVIEHLEANGIHNVLRKDIANLRQAHFNSKKSATKDTVPKEQVSEPTITRQTSIKQE